MTNRLRSALFIDFDNIFIGLHDLDPQAAYCFADQPDVWLTRLTESNLPDDHSRSILIRRAYLNPSARILDQERGNENGWLYLQRFRPALTRAGFEVVDCPALTAGKKNAADIRMVIDVLSCLDQDTRYDELIIASSDADFTPLLQRLRAEDRRTMIIASGNTSTAYQNVADEYVDEDNLLDLLRSNDVTDLQPAAEATLGATPQASSGGHGQGRNRAERVIRDQLRRSTEPVNLAALGLAVRKEIGSAQVADSNWFGDGSMSAFIRGLGGDPIEMANDHAWLPNLHTPAQGNQAQSVELPRFIADVCRNTDMPRLSQEAWQQIFATLAAYPEDAPATLAHATAWCRDRLVDADCPVGRKAINFIVRGAGQSGAYVLHVPRPAADEIRNAFLSNLMDQILATGMAPQQTEIDQLERWLGRE